VISFQVREYQAIERADCAEEQEEPAQTESAFCEGLWVRFVARRTREQCALPEGMSRREWDEIVRPG